MMQETKQGFTLLEMIVVICLVGLIMTLGMMQLSFLDATIAHAELDKLSTACSFLQQHAIVTNNECVLMCNSEKNEYWCDKVYEKLSHQISFGTLPGAKGAPGSASHVIQKPITFSDFQIHFYPTGIISSGTIYLIDKKKRFMYALSNAISQVSYLRLYRYDGIWKLLK